jgi:hypothetical protein
LTKLACFLPSEALDRFGVCDFACFANMHLRHSVTCILTGQNNMMQGRQVLAVPQACVASDVLLSFAAQLCWHDERQVAKPSIFTSGHASFLSEPLYNVALARGNALQIGRSACLSQYTGRVNVLQCQAVDGCAGREGRDWGGGRDLAPVRLPHHGGRRIHGVRVHSCSVVTCALQRICGFMPSMVAIMFITCQPHAWCRINLQTVQNHAGFVAMEVSTISFDPADSDATRLLKSLAVQFAWAGGLHGTCPSAHGRPTRRK